MLNLTLGIGIHLIFLICHWKLNYLHCERKSSAHPTRNDNPPKGVIAPKILICVIARTYRLPENNTIPKIKNKPAKGILGLGVWIESQATINKAIA